MTDYEKLLDEADDLIEGLRDPKIAHYAVGRAACTIDDARDIVPRLAAALREVMAERDRALGVGCDEVSEQLRQHVARVADTCEYWGARGDARALRKLASEHRTALADVEAMRAVVDAGCEIAEYEDCGKQYCGFCDHPLPDCSGVCCPGSRLRAALRALDARERDARERDARERDARATPSGGKGRTT